MPPRSRVCATPHPIASPADQAPAAPNRVPPLAALSPAMRRTLVTLLAGPLERRPRGWCRPGSTHVVAFPAAMEPLARKALVLVTRPGVHERARLTARGTAWARAAAAREADLLLAGALAGYDWLFERALKSLAAATPDARRAP
ncbi:hypothetical protein [Rhodoplanes sp. SY1]|uniref:hypothetical protein n=1 Tax=Rhodoplanes sp. SY1 TaxID=3166646 RepID=UPI0038B54025